MSNTTIESLPPQVQQQYTMRMLSVPTPRMIHTIAAEKKTMDANNGTIINFRRYNPLKTSKVKLDTDGSTPPPQQLSATDIKAEISFYGSHIRLNERVTLQVQDPKMDGVYKSSLIDLEALTGIAEGDRAQASESCAA